MADTTTELEVLDEIVEVLGGTSGQYETVVPTLQQILALLGGGGGGGGYNPALSVGRADALTGADSTAQWAQRVTTGSGAATVRSVQGAAEVIDGELVPVQISGIRSTTAQGGELDSVEWDISTYFPNGMYGLSDARDELTATEAITRVGFLDLGTVTWVKGNALTDGTGTVFWVGGVTLPSATFASAMILSPAWTKRTGSIVWESLSNGEYITLNSNIVVGGDSSLTTQQFKASMSGVMCAYALATPTTTPISPALPMSYKVQQGGTESIIVPDGEVSAAPIITVAEGKDAATVVMDALACIATPDGPVATANHAINTYLTMQGKLYKVTSAIAVGESITPNTNVTETTVMAELVARTA